LARRLEWDPVDLDQVLERSHGAIPDQVTRDGWAVFRSRERAAALALCDGRPRVLATGGGTTMDPEVRAAIGAAYRTVWLRAPLEVLRARVGEGTGRPAWDAAVERRYDERAAAYAACEHQVDADQPVERIVDQIVGWLGIEVPVDSEAGRYPVVIAPSLAGLRDHLDRRVIVVTESTVGPLWADAVRAELGDRVVGTVVLPAGEVNKTVATWSSCVDQLLGCGVDRDTVVVALGGGVLGDVAGFAASAVLRGVPVAQVPTTLLAMVDSSVGGKVAVNHPRGKNLIGAFHPPLLVWAATETLATLPPHELRSGWGEVLKTALVADPQLLDAIGDDQLPIARVIERCVRAKAAVVGADEREHGLRMVLNAGHTVGHALETAHGHGALAHGAAVAIGLVAEARFAVARGICVDRDLPDRLDACRARLGLPDNPPGAELDRLLAAMALDKKTSADKIRVPLPVRAGEMSIVELSRADLVELATSVVSPPNR
ncbi:MAG: 3-dehydroquinate synthase, partial [Myxococcota bacterium]